MPAQGAFRRTIFKRALSETGRLANCQRIAETTNNHRKKCRKAIAQNMLSFARDNRNNNKGFS